MSSTKIHALIIIGSGPAGYTAALYAARARLEPVLFAGWMAGGIAAGGQLTSTSIVENFPGFPKGIDGPELMVLMQEQAERFGTTVFIETVESVDLKTRPFTVSSNARSLKAHSIIIASGAIAKRMGIPGEDKYWDKGISACAICDAALPIFRNKELLVVGGGDSACEEAYFLTKFGSKVYMAVRRNELRASKEMQDRVLQHPKIEILWGTEVKEAHGGEGLRGTLESVTLFQKKDGKERQLPVSGLFYAIGHSPNSSFLAGQLTLDAAQYIVTTHNTQCSVEGVFACGDVQDAHYRQAITAAGSGCMAALDAEHWLASQKNII
ncbi:thioredoxin reductase-like [Ylistrum balloti]|uniref:thioredoxin reductase-like n=1 Tax=Ylistrum balloti TaxID=509963 RepID=UPI002905CD7D|nr:thioredoxin reductase-like [Ylistrum balloti]